MKKIFVILSIAAMAFTSCAEFDDVALWNKSMNMESRVTALEELCVRLNNEITSLQTIINAVKDNDSIVSVVPVIQNGEEIGYTITFTKSAPITIYHGKNGADGKNGDGYVPVIGVKQDSDGIYYWTLDGEWLTDDAGNKVKAEGRDGKDGADGKDGVDGKDGKDGVDGKDGKDGVDGKDGKDGADGKDGENGGSGNGSGDCNGCAPQLKIENGYWYISNDGGETWEQLGSAVGENGKDGKDGADGKSGKDGVDGKDGADGKDGKDGDSFFKSVDTSNAEYVIFVLADGTEIKVPYYSSLSISFDNNGKIAIKTNSTAEIAYTIESSLPDVEIEVVASVDLKAKVVKNTYLTGTIVISTGDVVDEYSHILVFVSNGDKTLMRKIAITEDSDGDGDDDNKDDDEEGLYFPDPIFRAYIMENFDQNGDGKLTRDEAALVKIINVRKSNSTPDNEKIATLEGIQYFVNLQQLSCYYNRITTLDLSKNIHLEVLMCQWNHTITTLDISKNTKLNYLQCQDNLLTTLDVSNNVELEFFWCYNNQLTSLDITKNIALREFSCHSNKLTSLDVSNNVELDRISCTNNQLTSLDVSKNTKLTDLNCMSNSLRNLDVSNNKMLTRIVCGWNQLEHLDLSQTTALNELHCSNNNLTELDVSKTNLGNSSESKPLDCHNNPLNILYLKRGWNIPYITQNRSDYYIPTQTEIIFVE